MTLDNRILGYLRPNRALPTAQIYQWVQCMTKNGGYSLVEFDEALMRLRNGGRIACANGYWYRRAFK